MFHSLCSLVRPTYLRASAWRNASKVGVSCLALMGAMWLVPTASVHGQTTVNYSFEDGVMRGDPTAMKVPPKILTESGNEFMRTTGSTGNCESVPSNLCPPRNRSTVRFTSSYSSMPLLSASNASQTYSARIRFHDNTGSDGVVFELYQNAPVGSTPYGTPDGKGPVFICWRDDGKVSCRANYANETKWDSFALGSIPAGTWHTYMVKAVWSHDPSKGRIEFYLDGVLKKRITGRDVNLGPASDRLPEMKLGMYGDYAVGAIDVDNVKAGPSSTSSNTVALSTPTNVRVVSGQ
jgi:Polysaccharide lyase